MKARIVFLLSSLVSFYALSIPTPNDEMLLKSLIERGVICSGLSYEQQQEALRIYLNQKARNKLNHNKDLKVDDASKKACIAPDTEVTNNEPS